MIPECNAIESTRPPAYQQLGPSDMLLLLRKCNAIAANMVRRLGLPRHERDDIRQDLILDALLRLRAFNPDRGSFEAFVGTIVAHRAGRVAKRLCRQRALEATSPIASEPLPLPAQDEVAVRGVAGGDPLELTHLRLDLQRAIEEFSSADVALCRELIESTPTQICESGKLSRASVYRRIKTIRTQLIMRGLVPIGGPLKRTAAMLP